MTVQVPKTAVISRQNFFQHKDTQTCLQVEGKVLMEEKENTLFRHIYT